MNLCALYKKMYHSSPTKPRFSVRKRLFGAAITASISFAAPWLFMSLPAHAADGTGTNTVSPAIAGISSISNSFTFTFTASESMASGEISITVPPDWSAPQGVAGTAGYVTAVSDGGLLGTELDAAENTTAWFGGSACSNGLTTDGSTKFEGNLSIKCANSDEVGGDRFYKAIPASNWSTYTTVSFWIRASADIANNRVFFGHDESATFASPADNTVGPLVANTWKHVTMTLAGAVGARDAVQSFGFIYRNSSIALDNVDIYVDDFLIGPGLPYFPGNGDVRMRLMQLTSGQQVTVLYGSGGGSSASTAPSVYGNSVFTTKTRSSSAGGLATIGSSPTISISAEVPSNVPPLVNIKKIVTPPSLPTGPGPITFNYTLTNPGRIAMSDVTLTDDQCDNIRFVSGDENNNELIETNEIWTYVCDGTISQSSLSFARAHATGNGMEAFDTVITEVVVGKPIIPPHIHLTRTPEPPSLPFGGGRVTYINYVSNPGTEPLKNVAVVSDECTAVKYTGGDLNQNSILEPNETWTYICSATISKTTLSTAVATGVANGHVALDPTIALVLVADTPLPEAIEPYGTADALANSPNITADKGLLPPADRARAKCAPGTRIRLADEEAVTHTSNPVYYCGENGKRYVFPDEATYYSWYPNFSGIVTLNAAELEAIPIGGNVTYRPGSHLIKTPSDSKVYAVAKGGVLRWVVGEITAERLYGQNWSTEVRDISESLFANYRIGPVITPPDAIPEIAPHPSTAPIASSNPSPSCTRGATFTRFLTTGSADAQVRPLQNLLQCLGFFPSDITASGFFGSATKDAVKKFQAANGISPAGHVGPATREALNRY
ncbi:peptidoglycan-binding protein [Patescibacteria group bacterium]|jgi:hypothetical protein|nr:peptidoglycan-binding protein [Patescibacteria group bacterium]